MYAARGHYGQYLLVIPKLNLVIAHKTRPQDYETAAQYDAIRVTWEQFMEIVDAVVDARVR